MSAAQVAFAAFGLVSQGLLVGFFAARRWWPGRARVLDRSAYGFAMVGLPLAGLLLLDGQTDFLSIGPLLMAGWALFGMFVDVWRPRAWRGPPVEWNVLVAYLAVYFFAQMFMWWPLWNFAREVWTVFLVLFVVNTALNIQGHARPGSRVA